MEKWRAEEEERHKESLTPQKKKLWHCPRKINSIKNCLNSASFKEFINFSAVVIT
jgi:hypothetical protein